MTDVSLTSPELPLPPTNLMFMGEDHKGMFRNGTSMLQFPKEVGFYDSGTTILDLGCGYGRLAYALIKEQHQGAYFGLDILARHIAWLKSNLIAYLPEGSNFLHLDVKNDRYNPTGNVEAKNLKLPDLPIVPQVAFLFSVFTHMYADDIDNYLSELRHTLGAGGKICVTFFLINSEMRSLESEGKSQFPLHFRHSDTCFYFSEEHPLHAIGYDEAWVKERLQANNFVIEQCSYGSWCGRKQAKTYQDTIIARSI